jgi:hypothetical protein
MFALCATLYRRRNAPNRSNLPPKSDWPRAAYVQRVRGTTRANGASATPPKLAPVCSEASSHCVVLGVEMEQPLKRGNFSNVSVVRPTRGLNRTNTALSRGTDGYAYQR